jgi:hypothetical protein
MECTKPPNLMRAQIAESYLNSGNSAPRVQSPARNSAPLAASRMTLNRSQTKDAPAEIVPVIKQIKLIMVNAPPLHRDGGRSTVGRNGKFQSSDTVRPIAP